MKAIHNMDLEQKGSMNTVFNTSKIQNESNSQHHAASVTECKTVFNTSKIQNESNSQQCMVFYWRYHYCV